MLKIIDNVDRRAQAWAERNMGTFMALGGVLEKFLDKDQSAQTTTPKKGAERSGTHVLKSASVLLTGLLLTGYAADRAYQLGIEEGQDALMSSPNTPMDRALSSDEVAEYSKYFLGVGNQQVGYDVHTVADGQAVPEVAVTTCNLSPQEIVDLIFKRNPPQPNDDCTTGLADTYGPQTDGVFMSMVFGDPRDYPSGDVWMGVSVANGKVVAAKTAESLGRYAPVG